MKRVKNSIIEDFKNIEHLADEIKDLTKDTMVIARAKKIKAITAKYN